MHTPVDSGVVCNVGGDGEGTRRRVLVEHHLGDGEGEGCRVRVRVRVWVWVRVRVRGER